MASRQRVVAGNHRHLVAIRITFLLVIKKNLKRSLMLSFLVNLKNFIRPEENDLLSDICGLYYKDIKIENDTSNVDS